MLNATLVKRIDVDTNLVILRVLPDFGVHNFSPGQYVALGLPECSPRPSDFPPESEPLTSEKLIKRAFSIGSPASEKGYLEFYIAILPTGALSSRLAALKEGDRLYAAPKITGTFTLHDVPQEKNLILIATGTGLAPYISMIRTAEVWAPGRQVTIAHGVRYRRDLAYREELLNLKKSQPTFNYYAFVSREDSEPGFFKKGYVQNIFESGDISVDPKRDHVFLCGNPSMIDDCEKLLMARGYVTHTKKHLEGSLHLERYW